MKWEEIKEFLCCLHSNVVYKIWTGTDYVRKRSHPLEISSSFLSFMLSLRDVFLVSTCRKYLMKNVAYLRLPEQRQNVIGLRNSLFINYYVDMYEFRL